MYYVCSMPKISEYKYWFKPSIFNRLGEWNVYDLKSENPFVSPIGTVTEKIDDLGFEDMVNISVFESNDVESLKVDILFDFNHFKNRPEYFICSRCSIEEPVDVLYDRLMYGAVLVSNQFTTDEAEQTLINRVERCLKWLHSNDFYEAPASTRFHGSEHCGLVVHSIDVFKEIRELWQLPKFSNVNLGHAALVALVHDWCKIGRYEPYLKNVKNENTGVWEKVESYRYKDSPLPFGHGETSVFIANKLLHLTTEQSLAIRWHMGWSRVYQQDMNDLQYSNENYPLVHMLQFADQLSIVNY